MLILDASSALDLLLTLGAHQRIRERIERPGETLHAPHVIDLEIVQGLRRLTRSRRVDPERSSSALEDFRDLRLERYAAIPFVERIWQLRDNVSAFDAAYIALAEALDAPLITSDAALARAPGIRARIEVYA